MRPRSPRGGTCGLGEDSDATRPGLPRSEDSIHGHDSRLKLIELTESLRLVRNGKVGFQSV